MKIRRSEGLVHIELSGAEAAWFLEELETVPKGSKFPKLRQMCFELRIALALGAREPDKPRGRPPTKPKPKLVVSPEVHEAAIQLGRLGGLKGGEARAASLSADERSRIASEAAKTRWYGPPDDEEDPRSTG